MALTSQETLRSMILLAPDTPEGGMTRTNTLDAIDRNWYMYWTDADLRSSRTRPFETNWRNRASYERARMVRKGLLHPYANGKWRLTGAGLRPDA